MSDKFTLPDIIAYGRVRRLEKEIIVKSAASNCGGPEKPRMVPGARPDSRADRAGAVPDLGVNGQSASSCSGFELQLVPSHRKRRPRRPPCRLGQISCERVQAAFFAASVASWAFAVTLPDSSSPVLDANSVVSVPNSCVTPPNDLVARMKRSACFCTKSL